MSDASTAPHEIELKLGFAPRTLKALRQHPLLQSAARQGRAQTLTNVYYDTPHLALKNKGIGLRIRRSGRTVLQTVKCSARSIAGLTSRPEWEQKYRNDGFDFASIDDCAVRNFLEKQRHALTPVFTTRFRRETYLLEQKGLRVLLMIDCGNVYTDDAQQALAEIELELLDGTAIQLFDLALQLTQDLPIWPENCSKAERGYRLHLKQELQPMQFMQSPIEPGQSVQEAFKSLAYELLRIWQTNAQGVQESMAPVFHHQLRVGLRRLRTLLRLFASALPPNFASHWNEKIGRLAHHIGNVRDYDVLHETILQPVVLAAQTHSSFTRLTQRIEAECHQRREELERNSYIQHSSRLQLGFARALFGLAQNNAGTIEVFSHKMLDKQLKQVRRRLHDAAQLDQQALHALRIAIKRLRYAEDFFSPLYPGKKFRQHLKRLVKLQDTLGFLNDLQVARQVFEQWGHAQPALIPESSFVIGWHARRACDIRRRLLDKGHLLFDDKAPWQ